MNGAAALEMEKIQFDVKMLVTRDDICLATGKRLSNKIAFMQCYPFIRT